MNVVDQHLRKYSFLFHSLNSHDANFFLLTFYAVYGGLSTSLGKMILSFALVAGFSPGWTLSLIWQVLKAAKFTRYFLLD
jgi:hypothetical protein